MSNEEVLKVFNGKSSFQKFVIGDNSFEKLEPKTSPAPWKDFWVSSVDGRVVVIYGRADVSKEQEQQLWKDAVARYGKPDKTWGSPQSGTEAYTWGDVTFGDTDIFIRTKINGKGIFYRRWLNKDGTLTITIQVREGGKVAAGD